MSDVIGRYDAKRLLDKALKKTKHPYFLLLVEDELAKLT
jgi:hypothetical protein